MKDHAGTIAYSLHLLISKLTGNYGDRQLALEDDKDLKNDLINDRFLRELLDMEASKATIDSETSIITPSVITELEGISIRVGLKGLKNNILNLSSERHLKTFQLALVLLQQYRKNHTDQFGSQLFPYTINQEVFNSQSFNLDKLVDNEFNIKSIIRMLHSFTLAQVPATDKAHIKSGHKVRSSLERADELTTEVLRIYKLFPALPVDDDQEDIKEGQIRKLRGIRTNG
jgi:hypothetical protein